MGKLIFSMSVSLDGFVNSASGSIDWVHVDEELHAHFNDEARSMSASVYGRWMYELMTAYWPTAEDDPTSTPVERDFARIWRDTPRLVISRTLADVAWNSRLVRGDALAEVARLKAQPGFDLDIGGPTTASAFIRAGLVDEYRLYVNPVVLGGGTPFFPTLDEPLRLDLVESRRFAAGVVMLRYEAAGRPAS
jgi:dihydrofolate reductase